MANELTDVGENLALDFLNGLAPTAPVGPLKLRAVTSAGTDSTAGAEVTGGSYAAQTIVLAAASAGSAANSAQITFAGMPAVSVVGFEIVDSSGTPRRLWYIPRTGGAVATSAGDSIIVDAGAIVVSLN